MIRVRLGKDSSPKVTKRKLKNRINGIQVAPKEFLEAKPLRHPDAEWKEDKKGLHVKLRAGIHPKKTLFSRFFSRLLPATRETRVLLDEQGAFIWRLCDGEQSIKGIAKRLSDQYKMLVPDAEAALDVYMVQLSKQGLVCFILPESTKRTHLKNQA